MFGAEDRSGGFLRINESEIRWREERKNSCFRFSEEVRKKDMIIRQ